MAASNDNGLSADWVELVRLNGMMPAYAYSAAELHYIRMVGPRGVENSLWFLRFEAAYRENVAQLRRGEMAVV